MRTHFYPPTTDAGFALFLPLSGRRYSSSYSCPPPPTPAQRKPLSLLRGFPHLEVSQITLHTDATHSLYEDYQGHRGSQQTDGGYLPPLFLFFVCSPPVHFWFDSSDSEQLNLLEGFAVGFSLLSLQLHKVQEISKRRDSPWACHRPRHAPRNMTAFRMTAFRKLNLLQAPAVVLLSLGSYL